LATSTRIKKHPILTKLYGKNSTALAEIGKLLGKIPPVLDEKENLL